jgi:Zn-dependent protease
VQLTIIQTISIWILPVLFAVTIHEVAHGYVAYLLGDKTARILGRLTLNPIKHIDIVGTIIIPVCLLLLNFKVIIGWAKPVPINNRYFNRPFRDMALVALAGPVANFIMAILWAAIAKIGFILLALNYPGVLAICKMGEAGISINLMLMVLNLLPIPPLDGSHVLASLLPRGIAISYERIAPWGFFILLALLYLGVINIIMYPVIMSLYDIILAIFNLSF